jgi:hypothetical protein
MPSDEWLQQLPHKARKLEGRLYHSAPSLEAYIDRITLKTRLKMLARVIMVQYRDSRRSSSGQLPASFLSKASRASAGMRSCSISSQFSLPSVASAAVHRNSSISHTSIDSLRSLQESMNTKTSIERPPNKKQVQARRSSTKRSTNNGSMQGKKRRSSKDTIDTVIPKGGGSNSHRQSVTSLGSNEGDPVLPAPGMTQEFFQQQIVNNTLSADPSAMISASGTLHTAPTALPMGGPIGNIPSELGGQQPPITSSSQNMTELERQKAVNALLQEQIMDNIRRQEDLVRRLQASEPQQQPHYSHSRDDSYHSDIDIEPNDLQRSAPLNGLSMSASASSNANVTAALQQQHQQQHQGSLNIPMHPNMAAFMNGAGGSQVPPNMLMAEVALFNNRLNQQNPYVGQIPAFQQQQQQYGGGMHLPPVPNFSNPMMGLGGNGNMMTNLASQQQPQGLQHYIHQLSQQQQQEQLQQMYGGGSMLTTNNNPLASQMRSLQQQQQQNNGNSNIDNRLLNGFLPTNGRRPSVGLNELDGSSQDVAETPLSPGSFSWWE